MITFFNNNRFVLLSGSLVFALLAACWVDASNTRLDTPSAPDKIVSLALAWGVEKANKVADSWRGDLLDVALKTIYKDYLFILTYVVFLSFCIIARNRGLVVSKTTKVFLTLAWLAGSCDVVENIFMARFLQARNVHPVFFSLAASIKFFLLAVAGVYILYFLRYKWRYFTFSLRAFRIYFAGLAGVLVSYFVFIGLAQGQDIIMQIGEWPGPLWWTFVCTILWSLYSWYSSRLVGYVKYSQPDNILPDSFHQHTPRLIAFNAVVSIEAAVLALPTIGHLTEGELWTFVIAQNILYFILDGLSTNSGRRPLYIIITIVAVAAYAAWVIISMLAKPPFTHQLRLPFVAFLLFIFQFILMWLFILRRKKISEKATPTLSGSEQRTGHLKLFKMNVVDIPVQLETQEQSFFNAFNMLAFLGVVLYFIGFFSLYLVDRMGPLAFTLLSFGILVGLSNIVTVFSTYKRTNFFFLLFMLAMLLGRVYDPYKVRLIGTENQNFYAHRPDLKTYFTKWIRQRKDLIADYDTFPVYLVIADGGASRSGYWVASVLSALQDSTIRYDSSDIFSDHLLCLAGASGGSVGNATFYALLKNKERNDDTFLKHARAFLKQDFLTPVITRWLGSDFIQHMIPLPVGDRAAALEEAMEYFSSESLDDSFSKPFSEVMDLTGKLPILFINTTHLQEGAPAVVSSVKLNPFSQRLDVLDSVEKTTSVEKGDLRYSTAVVLGARFPYVSPAGSIDKAYFVDGGYFDNTGAGIVHEMMQMLDSSFRTGPDSLLFSKLRFVLLYLSNSGLQATGNKPLHPLMNDMAAPVLTVLGTYSSQTTVNNKRLTSFLTASNPRNRCYEINLYTEYDSIEYPMNWVISDYNLDRMNQRLEVVKKTEFPKILYQGKN